MTPSVCIKTWNLYVSVCVCVHARVCAYLLGCVRVGVVCECTCVRACLLACMCLGLHACMHVCMYVCMYVRK